MIDGEKVPASKGGNSSTQEFVNELTVKGELPKGKP
jgi:hypothetical protein